ncbi:MAG: hypothetical protein P9X26_05460 [Candidatus Stygibacter frigidus]|nr:hypothetical protein [Candidatus Stygibacter frigidus]
MRKIYSFLILSSLFACSINTTTRNLQPVEFTEIFTLKTDIKIEIACYNSIDQVTYIWETNTDKIHIFNREVEVNTIGGKGVDNTNFQKLSDICLAPDGDLFALDSFDNSLKKFNKTGKMTGKLLINGNLDPKLVVIALDQKIYIYDDKRNEIVVLDYKGNEIAAWGNLEFGEIASLELYNDLLAVYDLMNDETLFFSTYGQLIDQHQGRCYLENDQLFYLQRYYLEHKANNAKFAVNTTPWLKVFFQSPEIIMYDGKKLILGKIRYEKYSI